MKVFYRTKEESNKEQEKEFLSLSPAGRIYRFFELMMQSKKYPSKRKHKNNNFIIEIITDNN